MIFPSETRTIYLTSAALLPPVPGIAQVGPPLIWPSKAPGDTLDFTLDCSQFLGEIEDSINPSTVSVTTTPSDLVASSLTVNAAANALTWIFSGGTVTTPSLTTYQVAVSFHTIGGLIVTRACWMQIAPLSMLIAPYGQLTVTGGPWPTTQAQWQTLIAGILTNISNAQAQQLAALVAANTIITPDNP